MATGLSTYFRLLGDRRGSIVPLAAAAMVALIAVGALAIELGQVYFVKSANQRVADAAALAAGMTYSATSNAAAMTAAAKNIGQLNGFATSAVTATLVPSPSGDGNQAVQVDVMTNVPLRLARAVGFGTSMNVSARAAAELKPASVPCILGLAGTGTSVTITGGAQLSSNGCSIGGGNNVAIDGGSTVVAQAVYAGGTVSVTNATLTTKPAANNITQHYSGISDPIAGNSALQAAFSSIPSLGGSVANPTTPTSVVALAFNWTPTGASDPTYPYYSGTGGLYNKGTLPCSGGSYAIDSITVGGSVSVAINATAGCAYTVRNGINNGGILLRLSGTAASWKINKGTSSYGIATGSGTTNLAATAFTVGGGISVGGNGTLSLTNAGTIAINSGITTGGSSISTFSANLYQIAGAVNLSGTVNWQTSGINPDINFYNAVSLGLGGGTFTFGDGTYSVNGDLLLSSGPTYIGNGQLLINGNLTVNSGASLCGTPAPCGSGTSTISIVNDALVTISGGSVVNLDPPASGAAYGIPSILMASNYAGAMQFNGGANSTLSGALYFPNATATFSNGTNTGGASCFEIVASAVSISGGATVASTCPAFGGIGSAAAVLVY